jgi:hypothetical protein
VPPPWRPRLHPRVRAPTSPSLRVRIRRFRCLLLLCVRDLAYAPLEGHHAPPPHPQIPGAVHPACPRPTTLFLAASAPQPPRHPHPAPIRTPTPMTAPHEDPVPSDFGAATIAPFPPIRNLAPRRAIPTHPQPHPRRPSRDHPFATCPLPSPDGTGSSKVTTGDDLDGWRRRGQRRGHGLWEEGDHDGGQCQSMDFSGVIYYDAEGHHVAQPPSRR